MKVFSAIFLFVALTAMFYANVLQVGGLYVNIQQAKKEAAQQLKSHSVYTLTISDNDFITGRAQYLNDNEISFDGRLYDIATSSRQAGKTSLSVYYDEKEEGLVAKLKDEVDSWLNTPKNSKHPAGKQLLTIKDYVPATKFTLYINGSVTEILPVVFSYAVQAPCLLVPHSPPNLV